MQVTLGRGPGFDPATMKMSSILMTGFMVPMSGVIILTTLVISGTLGIQIA